MNLKASQDYSRQVVEILKEIRLEKGISQNKLAELAGVSRGAVQHIEKGIRNPTLIVIHALARALESSVAQITREAETRER